MMPSSDDASSSNGRSERIPHTFHLPPDSLQWLSEEANQRNETVDQVLQSILRREMTKSNAETSTASSSDEDSVLDRLRRAEQALMELDAEDEHSELESSRSETTAASEKDDEQEHSPSMFDLAEGHL